MFGTPRGVRRLGRGLGGSGDTRVMIIGELCIYFIAAVREDSTNI